MKNLRLLLLIVGVMMFKSSDGFYFLKESDAKEHDIVVDAKIRIDEKESLRLKRNPYTISILDEQEVFFDKDARARGGVR